MFLVTGANGVLGRQVIDHLLGRVPAEQVAVSVREPSQAADLAALGVTVRAGDFDDPSTLDFSGISRMLLISTASLPHQRRYDQHAAAIKAAGAAGVADIVYTSLSVSTPDSIRAVHQKTEDAILATGMRYTFLRHPLYTSNFLNRTEGETELISGTGNGRVATAARSDLAEAAAIVLASGGHHDEVLTFTGPAAWSYDELAELCSITHRAVDAAEFERLLIAEEVPDFLVHILGDIHASIAAGHLSQVTDDLAEVLGRQPLSLSDSVAQLS